MLPKAAPADIPLPDDAGRAGKISKSHFWFLTVGCVGVVYGDIGTNPLYAFRVAITEAAAGGIPQSTEIFGVLSLIIWALILIVSLKYVLFLLHVNNRGDGGILSLMALAQRAVGRTHPSIVLFLGIFGAALFYGDASITPAISVLSAVEGIGLVTPAFDGMALPIAIVILFVLFSLQKRGTGKMSVLFGPIMVIWFLVMGITGLSQIVQNPAILMAFNPLYGFSFLTHHGWISLIVLGAVFLAVTGSETLYADLGHFGIKPIQTAWLWLVFPCLVLNYLGQGAFVLANPSGIENPFYLMVPEWALLPLVGMATIATITASQAVITGAYSLTRQAIQLGLLPRMEIRHTSMNQEGQIFIPKINRLLLYVVLLLCLTFGSSAALASAYGVAVSLTMVVTTILAFVVLWKVWKKNVFLAAMIALPFLCIEAVFTSANMLKVFDGGFVPLVMATLLIVMMLTWVSGTRYLRKKDHRQSIGLTDLMEKLDREQPTRIDGTAVFLTSNPHDAPIALLQNLKHNKVLHNHNVVLTILNVDASRIPDDQKIVVEHLSSTMTRVLVSFGYMEIPDVPRALVLAQCYGLEINLDEASFFLGKRSIISDPKRGLPEWQDHIYIAMAKSAASATDFYRIPYNRVVELGMQITV
ncbi:MAG: potassium transporter Kup [Micavibrio sp.]